MVDSSRAGAGSELVGTSKVVADESIRLVVIGRWLISISPLSFSAWVLGRG